MGTLGTLPIHPQFRPILARTWVRTSTWEGHTVMCGCEWYQPTTLMGRPVVSAKRSASVLAADSCSGEISTRSFLLSERRRMMTECTWTTRLVSSSPMHRPITCHGIILTFQTNYTVIMSLCQSYKSNANMRPFAYHTLTCWLHEKNQAIALLTREPVGTLQYTNGTSRKQDKCMTRHFHKL